MRTKTLILTAALSAAGVATSMAQAVYSVNAVGYVNTTLVPGFNLISNPLTAANNKISSLFVGVPDGTQVYKFVNGAFQTTTWIEAFESWNPANVADQDVIPGEGVFVRNPTAANVTITFVGEVPQGNLSNPLPAGLSIKSSQVPQAGTATALGLPAADGDQLYQFNEATQSYRTSTYIEAFESWNPDLQPLAVGEAFFLRRATAGTWSRTFSVNQ